ncbi:MAG: FG-GAP repeat domain-containing protein [Aureliella sp.]
MEKTLAWIVAFGCLLGGQPVLLGQTSANSEPQSSNAGSLLPGHPWLRHSVDDELRGADGAKLADANGDGLLDIVTGWEESGRTRAYLHPGVQAVTAPWAHVDLGVTPSVEDAVWVDLDRDGRLDVLSCCEGKEQALYAHISPIFAEWLDSHAWTKTVISASRGKTRWMFAQPLTLANAVNAQASVVEASHRRVDVVVGSKSPNGQLSILSVEDGNMESATIVPLVDAAWIMSIEVLDVDGDGDRDILYTDRKGAQSGVYWLENLDADQPASLKSKWKRHAIGGLGREVMFLSVDEKENTAAIHGDSRGSVDAIYVPAKPNSVFVFRIESRNDRSTNWSSSEILVEPVSAMGFAKSVVVANLDADQEPELVYACESAVAPKVGVLYLDFNGADWEAKNISGSEGIKFDAMQAVDLDQDGDLDILTCEERERGRGMGLFWYENPEKKFTLK